MMSDWQRKLDNALNRLGLQPSKHQLGKDEKPLVFNTADIVLESAKDWADITTDPTTGALLNAQQQTIVVYIKDHSFLSYNSHRNNSFDLTDYERLNKLHLTWCGKLVSMEREGKYERYIGTQSRINTYPIDVPRYKDEQDVYLRPCINCLRKVYENPGYSESEKKEYFDNFHVRDWFEYCDENNVTQPQRTRYNSDTMPKAEYTDIFKDRAKQLKEQCNYICSKCGKDCSNDKKNLHCHHKNAIKGDNRYENLEILCYDCHAKHHPHMQ